MRIVIRTSRMAIWARRLAVFASAILLLSTGLHMFGQVASDVFEICLLVGTATAGLAVLLAVAAYIKLWFSGEKGWRPASVGFFVGLICLGPAVYAGAMVLAYPSTADVTTALANPPVLVASVESDAGLDPESILKSFPNLITRSYQIPATTLYDLVQVVVRQRGWGVVRSMPPASAQSQGSLNATRRSLFGWENEIAILIAPSGFGSHIDVRSASSRPTLHDLGENGRTIENFLLALDDIVTQHVQETMALAGDDDLPEVIIDAESLDQ